MVWLKTVSLEGNLGQLKPSKNFAHTIGLITITLNQARIAGCIEDTSKEVGLGLVCGSLNIPEANTSSA